MAYPLLIGRRAILSRENRLLINLTTWIAVAGVALGVAALVVVNAVYDGYIAEIRGTFASVLSHINLTCRWGSDGAIPCDEAFLERLDSEPGVEAAAPLIHRQALMLPRHAWRGSGVQVLGFDAARARGVSDLPNRVIEGEGSPGEGEIVLGRVLAERLGVGVGDTVVVLSDFDTSGPGRPRAQSRQLRVIGLFSSGFYQFDQMFSYVRLDVARSIFDVPEGWADRIELRVTDPWRAGEIRDSLVAGLMGERPEAMRGLEGETWREMFSDFFRGVEYTRIILLVLLLLLVAVASSNVIGSLVMMVHDRTREIGILRAMGATRGALTQVFMLCGFVIGVLGVVVGLGLGSLLCVALAQWRLIEISAAVYFIDHLPVVIDWVKIALISGATVLICLVASVAPALRASRLDPVEALRCE